MTEVELELELDAKIRERRAAVLEKGLRQIGPEPVRWLALLPEWTDELAGYCRFPAGPGGVKAFVERAERQGFCEAETEQDIDGSVTRRFWMPSPIRSALMEHWGLDRGLQEETRKIALQILEAERDRPEVVSTGLLRWAQLVHGELDRGAVTGSGLIEAVDASLAAGDPGDAGNWITAGKELAEPLGAEMDAAAELAQRRISFYYRGLQDAEYLRRFIPRQELSEEVDRLLASDSKHWAVHFIGPGGVGKTMLMRYLTSRDADRPIASPARIDFDYMDPRYPLESPARLLHELAEELAVDLSDGTQESLFRSFREAVTRAEGVRLDLGNDPMHPFSTDPFEEAVEAFAAFVRELPQPVVLILDTCEELAKLHPPGEDVPSISATFKILERIHKAAPQVKVIFAGRRWLTPKAANAERDQAAPGSVMCMEPRPYMRMQEVRGFTAAEVDAFLTKACGRQPSPAVLDAVLEATADTARAPGFGEGGDEDEGPRYNPTDVALLGGWLEDDPNLSPERLAAGNLDRFVEARILGRLESAALEAAIPAAILLERFDAAMIEPALPRDPAERAATLNGLLEQEWTHLEGGPDPEDIVIRVDGGLLLRLENYYGRTSERQLQIDDTQSKLVPHLGELMERGPEGVSVEAIDAAMRLLPLEEAARRFDRLANRVAEQGAWSWAGAVCSRLLSQERTPLLDARLVASVGALYVAALAQRRSRVSLAPFWMQVAEESAKHPDSTQAIALDIRGRLGELAALAGEGEVPETTPEILARASGSVGRLGAVTPIAPALLAAVEALLNAHEEHQSELPTELTAECLRVLFDRFDGDELIQAQILALKGRLYAADENWAAARKTFDRLERLPLADDPPGPRFVDWVAPSSLRHRVLLELLRFRLADGAEGGILLRRCEKAALDCIDGADAAQLLSLTIRARLVRGDRSELEECLPLARRYEAKVEGYDLVAPAHRVAPQLFVSLAEAMDALGDAGSALRLLSERERVATSRRTDEDAAHAAALATVRVLRRLRRRERFALIGGSGDDEDEELRAETVAAGALIAGLQPQLGREIEDHAAWRARILLGLSAKELGVLARPRGRGDAVAEAHYALDNIEANTLLPQRPRLAAVWGRHRAATFVERVCCEREAPTIADPFGAEGLRLRLRRLALVAGPDESEAWIPPARRRLVGAIAMDEGELLALRLPERALPLLALAERHLAEAGDAHGAFAASLRWAIAAIHCGRYDEAHAQRGDILALYETARRVDPSLPADPRAPVDPAGAECHWSAWVERLATYLDWCELDSSEPDSPQLRRGGSLQLEPELTLVEAAQDVGRLDWDAHRGDIEELSLALVEAPDRRGSGPQFEVTVDYWPRSLGSRMAGILRNAARSYFPGFFPPPRFPLFEGPIGPGSPSALAESLGSRIKQPRLSVRLLVAPGLATVDWERRLIGHLVSPGNWNEEELPEIWRVPPYGARAAAPSHWSPFTVPVCSQRWQPLVASSVEDPVQLLPFSHVSHGETSMDAGVALALGLPAVTRAGWRLRLDDDELSVPLDDPGAPRRQELISPDRLAGIAPILLIFGRPGGPRLSADSRSAEGLRGFANEAFLAGAHAAIAVPVLPPDLTSTAIAFATGRIAGWEETPSTKQLRELADGLRRVAAGWAGDPRHLDPRRAPSQQQEIEPALDVSLFVRG